MRLWQAEATQILERGGKLRKVYWNPGDHMIMHGVWFFRTTNVYTSKMIERLLLGGMSYQPYLLSYDSIFLNDWEEIITPKNYAGFGLEPF
jgi:hypothetical protein